jgi:hypothetical protein
VLSGWGTSWGTEVRYNMPMANDPVKKLQVDLRQERIWFGPTLTVPAGATLVTGGYQVGTEPGLLACDAVGCRLPAGHEGEHGDSGALVLPQASKVVDDEREEDQADG